MRYSLPPTAACPDRSLKHPVGRARIHPGPKAAARIGRRIAAPHQLQRPPELPLGVLRGRQQHGRAGPQQPDHGPCIIGVRHIRLAVDQHVHEKTLLAAYQTPDHTTGRKWQQYGHAPHPIPPGTMPRGCSFLKKANADTRLEKKSPFHFPHIHQFTDGA